MAEAAALLPGTSGRTGSSDSEGGTEDEAMVLPASAKAEVEACFAHGLRMFPDSATMYIMFSYFHRHITGVSQRTNGRMCFVWKSLLLSRTTIKSFVNLLKPRVCAPPLDGNTTFTKEGGR